MGKYCFKGIGWGKITISYIDSEDGFGLNPCIYGGSYKNMRHDEGVHTKSGANIVHYIIVEGGIRHRRGIHRRARGYTGGRWDTPAGEGVHRRAMSVHRRAMGVHRRTRGEHHTGGGYTRRTRPTMVLRERMSSFGSRKGL